MPGGLGLAWLGPLWAATRPLTIRAGPQDTHRIAAGKGCPVGVLWVSCGRSHLDGSPVGMESSAKGLR